ncbi:MAG: methyltransferase regulatory domain-containing protein, partial [Pirellulales bacterium]|nr:methyltransferase regulatory domain-containing protein [Pirellulales bacterium]
MTSYDSVPYPSLPIRRTHPCQLAALGRLFGLDCPSPRRCRVLELGCAAGGNLLPMAADLPEARFLGIDASARQVDQGKAGIRAAGLTNIELHVQDLARFPEDSGQFDFILCHGVYSWVPPPVQDRILEIGRRHLAPHGVFYVSYNTFPGWHLRGVVRDMMRFHVRRFDDSRAKISQSRLLLDFLVKSAASGEAYRQLLRDEAAILSEQPDSYLFHEHLEDDNEPLYFYQFVERAEAAGLVYLADADFSTMVAANFGQEIAGLLENASRLVQEQYLDFLRNRTFRASLLCRAEEKLDLAIDPMRLAACDVSLEERLELPPLRLDDDSPLVCRCQGDTLTATGPLTKAALAVLNDRWPLPLAFDDLLREARAKLSAAGRTLGEEEPYRRRLAQDLLTLLTRRLLRIMVEAPRIATAAGALPRATP